ncbi:AAA family ATPase [Saccharopolyspora indica]|uniref:helix-turn-helix transcriptional regulator n=1 Tax=Saccharopolyspora indica TaxID=1229659 RepID=UPI0022EB727E|nr:LuxR family transcriptional regulator [Saccharopolyspora indica]MDA3647908.1 AAA family ATPase [Saccharopolyspora indica]
MELAERRRELDLLTRLFAHCQQSRGQIALITGGVASGKTHLLNTFADQATDTNALLLTAIGSRDEQELQLGVVGQLLHGVTLPPVEDKLAELLNEHALAQASTDERTSRDIDVWFTHRLSTALLDLAHHRPVLICIDDLQFIDHASLQIMRHLFRRLRSARIMVLMTSSTRPRLAEMPLQTEFARLPFFSHVPLAPLSRVDVVEALSQQLDATTADRLSTTYHQLSGGNPLLLQALLEDHVTTSGLGGTEPVVGAAFARTVLMCLHRCEAPLLQVGRAISVLGEFSRPALIARLTEIQLAEVERALGELEASGLIADCTFRHPAAHSAVLQDITPQERISLHARTGELLFHEGAAPAAISEHLIAAGRVDGRWAVDLLRETAEQALMEDDPQLAMACLEVARDGTDDERERATITASLTQIEWRTRPGRANPRVAGLLDSLHKGHLSEERTLELVKYLLWQGMPAQAAETLRTLMESADPSFRAELQLTYRLLSISHPPFFPVDQLDSTTEQLAELVASTSKPWGQAAVALALVMSPGNGDDRLEAGVQAAVHLLQRTLLSDETIDALLTALLTLIYADKTNDALDHCNALIAEARSRQADAWEALLNNVRADIALRQGDPLTAAEHCRLALDKISFQGWGVGIGGLLAVQLRSATIMGDFDEAAKLVRRTMPDGMFQTWFGPQYLHARGHFFLATDRPYAALSDFQHCGALMTKWGIDNATVAPWRTDSAQVHLQLGKREQARKLAATQLELPGIGSRTRGISLRILAAASPFEERLALLSEAVEHLTACGDRIELANALVDVLNVHHVRGNHHEARRVARRALDMARGTHAVALYQNLLAGRAALALDADEVPVASEPTGVAALSRAEWRVAALASLGHTNRDIGHKLNVTVSTVEQHLTRVYRKLAINGRAELPMRLTMVGELTDIEAELVTQDRGRAGETLRSLA